MDANNATSSKRSALASYALASGGGDIDHQTSIPTTIAVEIAKTVSGVGHRLEEDTLEPAADSTEHCRHDARNIRRRRWRWRPCLVVDPLAANHASSPIDLFEIIEHIVHANGRLPEFIEHLVSPCPGLKWIAFELEFSRPGSFLIQFVRATHD
jgi:hypothetical protein